MAHFLIQCLNTKLSGIKHGFFKKRRAFFLSDKSDGKFMQMFDSGSSQTLHVTGPLGLTAF